jgi:hypothetical protein
MVGVMKEERILPAARAVTANPPNQVGRVPLVHEDEVGTIERPLEVEPVGCVDRKRRCGNEAGRRRSPLGRRPSSGAAGSSRRRVRKRAPRAAAPVFRHQAAKEMRVPMVPIGYQRVAEDDDFHDSTTCRPMSASISAARCSYV